MLKIFPKIAVVDDAKLAANLDLELINLALIDDSFDFLLLKKSNILQLQPTKLNNSSLMIDFLDKSLLYRSKKATCSNEALAKAVGLKPNKSLNVIDATAGLGKDAFILASLGAKVTLLERSNIVSALLEDALFRAKDQTLNMKLIKTDAIDFLSNISANDAPDVVYLDPMFPTRSKSSAVKKDMKMLQILLGHDQDEEKLLKVSLSCANRVVLKRPNWANLPTFAKPHMKITTPNHYFAVYINHNFKNI